MPMVHTAIHNYCIFVCVVSQLSGQQIISFLADGVFNCFLIGTPVGTQHPKKWISSKAVFVILLLCSAVATLAFIALMLCYVYQRDKYSIQRHLFSPDKETSFSSATNLISQGASSETESKVSAATPINFVSGKNCWSKCWNVKAAIF